MSGAKHQMFDLARPVPGRDHVAVPAERKNLARPDEVIRLDGQWALSTLVA
jgi:hypothetical protein